MPPSIWYFSLMSRFNVLKELKPARVLRGIRNRGVKGAAYFALRRAGTIADHALIGPHLVRINPMDYACNHTCPMCWLQYLAPDELKAQKKRDREQGMTAAEYMRVFDGMPSGVGEINIVGGGEPLIHPEIAAIMRSIKEHGWRGWIITNGTLMKEELSREMTGMDWDMVRVSVHAGDRETYRRIQGADRFEILQSNLKAYSRLRKAKRATGKCQLVILNVLQHENIPTIERLFQFAEEMEADSIVFEKIVPYDREKFLTAGELRRAQDSLRSCARDSTIPCNLADALAQLAVEEACARESKPFRPARRCSVGFDQTFITALGDVRPCCYSDEIMGNVREQPFRDIWEAEKYREFRSRLMRGQFAKYCITNRCAL
ncbi:SPASM domain-containing protein, partial [Candidatus Sumerlaeota bacterium]|nr:SPASM domain-containing protein [Candidatus Sumerlaeota bacterium]